MNPWLVWCIVAVLVIVLVVRDFVQRVRNNMWL